MQYVRGQRELGAGGFEHWQILVAFKKKIRLLGVKRFFGEQCHSELSRSAAADAYVWKEETRIEGTQFELGSRAIKRNSSTDWELVRKSATAGAWDDIPPDVFVRYYGNLRRIHSDNAKPVAQIRTCRTFVGATGTGKSKLAWEEAGEDAYVKNPTTKWWDGYKGSMVLISGQEHVIIDEFRGDINISHLLRWLDRYPVLLEIKGSSVPLLATTFWICSNLTPKEWYPLVDEPSMDALLRRMEVIKFVSFPYNFIYGLGSNLYLWVR